MSLYQLLKHLPGKHNQQLHNPNAQSMSRLSQQEYVTSLSAVDVAAVYEYTFSGYKQLNKELRAGDTTNPGIAVLDAVLDSAPAVSQKKVYRALFATPGEINMAVGDIYTDNAYMSTTKSSKVMYMLAAPTRVTIKVPPGTPGLDVSGISYKRHEEEILFGRDSQMRILKIQYSEEFDKYDVLAELVR